LTREGKERKLPVKALKERAAGFGGKRRGGWCEPREEPVGCRSRAGRKKAETRVEPSRSRRVRAKNLMGFMRGGIELPQFEWYRGYEIMLVSKQALR
jgi:hypothetical protein